MINKKEIHDICKKYEITNYRINDDGSIDVNGDVSIGYAILSREAGNDTWRISKIPIKFNKVSGNFICVSHNLTTLYNCPNYVGGDFDISSNDITNLIGGPSCVGGEYVFYFNSLTSLDGYLGNYKNLKYDKDKLIKLVRKDKLSKIKTLLQ